MIKVAKIVGKLVIVLIALQGCKPEKCDDPVPSMVYKNFNRLGDSAYLLQFDFKDCDGDIGLTPSDTMPPYDFNFKVDAFYLEDGDWKQIDFSNSIGLNARIVPLTEDGIEQVTEGTIDHFINPVVFAGLGDTLRFRGTLIDRALNESVPVEGIAVFDNIF